MRTTLDLPDELLKQAKIAAVERGSTLRDLVARSLRRELAAPLSRPRLPRASLPAVRVGDDAPVLRMSAAALKAVAATLAREDDFGRAA